jgi:hypothetical protein
VPKNFISHPIELTGDDIVVEYIERLEKTLKDKEDLLPNKLKEKIE